MPYCSNCRTYIQDVETVCPVCGNVNKRQAQQTNPTPNSSSVRKSGFFRRLMSMADYTCDYSEFERREKRAIALLAYLGPLCLITLLAGRKSKYAMFHFFQGLLNLVAFILITVIINLFASFASSGLIGFIFFIVFLILLAIPAVFLILGLVNVIKCKAQTLPLWGRINIMKLFYKK